MMYFSKEELLILIESVNETHNLTGTNPKAQELIEKLKYQLESME